MGLLGATYLFVAIVDPWGMLPLSPPLPRVPISTNARFSMPALARSQQFDSAVIGNSTSRLLRPAVLDERLGGRFVNLAMNAATAWEQGQMLGLFSRWHPAPRTLVIGLDTAWCTELPERNTGRAFPDWMYGGSRWMGYREIATSYAVQEAASQLWVMLGLKRRRYGLDGYTDFLPPETAYDPARVAAAFARWTPVPTAKARLVGGYRFPELPMLAERLRAVPAATRKLVFFTPGHVSQQGAAGSDLSGLLAGCKRAVAAIAATVPGSVVVDFDIPSPVTSDRANYWDPVHYRKPIADRLVEDLALAVQGTGTPDDAILAVNPPR